MHLKNLDILLLQECLESELELRVEPILGSRFRMNPKSQGLGFSLQLIQHRNLMIAGECCYVGIRPMNQEPAVSL
jgi:hypothetical protein